MGFLREFQKLHIGLRTAILSVISLFPIYFTAIYLFKPEFIATVDRSSILNDIDFIFMLALCFALSLAWFFMNYLLTAFIDWFAQYLFGEDTDEESLYIATYIYSVAYVCAFILIGNWQDFSFIQFLGWSYTFIIFRIILIVAMRLIIGRIISTHEEEPPNEPVTPEPMSTQPETTGEDEGMKQLYESRKYSFAEFDKSVLFIASGALGVSFSFLDKLIDIKTASDKNLLFLSWYFFSAVIFLNLCGHFVSSLAHNWAIRNYNDDNYEKTYKRWSWTIRTLNVLMIMGLTTGFIIFILFMNYNLK